MLTHQRCIQICWWQIAWHISLQSDLLSQHGSPVQSSCIMDMYNNPQPYDPGAGPWPVEFSEEEKQAQRDAGRDLIQRFKDVQEQGGQEFDLPEGVFRITEPFLLDNCEAMHFKASNTELICEGADRPPHFRCNFYPILVGPLALKGRAGLLVTIPKVRTEYNGPI